MPKRPRTSRGFAPRFESLEPRLLLAPVVGTDKLDYLPGEVALITAQGFATGDTVEFQVLHVTDPGDDGMYGTADDVLGDNSGGGHAPWRVRDGSVADDLDGQSNASIRTPWYVNPDDSAGATFRLTATVLASGEVATTVFTDSNGGPIHIRKVTNGTDGLTLLAGTPVTWTYRVTNSDEWPIDRVAVTDSDAGVTPVFQSGDDGDGRLEIGETWIYTAAGTVQTGNYTNTGTATGEHEVPDFPPETVSASDASSYFGADPSIDLEKATNGEDADTPTGPQIQVGLTAVFTYVVTNTGNVDLTNVDLSDNQLGQVTTISGNGNGDAILDVGESWTYTASTTVVAGQYANIGTVTAETIEIPDFPEFPATEVTASDPSHHFGLDRLELTGTKFFDRNANGFWDEAGADGLLGTADDENGLAGWSILVFADDGSGTGGVAGNGILEQGEFDAGPVASTATATQAQADADPNDLLVRRGDYAFDLSAGDYIVVEVIQPGWLQSHPLGASVLAPGLNPGATPVGAKGHTTSITDYRLAGDFGNFLIGKHLLTSTYSPPYQGNVDLSQGDIWIVIDPGNRNLIARAGYNANDGLVQIDLYDQNMRVIAASGSQIVFAADPATERYLHVYGNNPSVDLRVRTRVTPLRAAGGEGGGATPIGPKQLTGIVTTARRRWSATGLAAGDVALLNRTTVGISDLPDGWLAKTVGTRIQIDPTAAGRGWYVDRHPGNEAEFRRFVGGAELQATRGIGATKMDLLTAVMHELGHVLGRTDLPARGAANDLMESSLPVGIRRLPDGATPVWPAKGRIWLDPLPDSSQFRVRVAGTPDDDSFRVKPRGWHTYEVTINGIWHSVSASAVSSVVINGGGGTDQVTMFDSKGNDVARLYPGRAILSGPSYHVKAVNAENVRILARHGGSADRVFFYDSTASDRFVSRADQKWAQLNGPGYSNRAIGFEHNHAIFSAGGTHDRAFYYDSAADDQFDLWQNRSTMRAETFHTTARGFDRLRVISKTTGDVDRVAFRDAGNNRVTRSNFEKIVDYLFSIDPAV